MKLHEMMPDPSDVLDTQVVQRDAEAHTPVTDTKHIEKQLRSKPPRKDSNIEKAKRIKTLARLKKRTQVPDPEQHNDETPAQSSGGIHGSTFLLR